jgi:hypothetical protein
MALQGKKTKGKGKEKTTITFNKTAHSFGTLSRPSIES